MSLAASFVYRAPRQSDLAWIKQTWIRSYRGHGRYYKSPVVRMVSGPVYSAGQDALVTRLLGRSLLTCATRRDDDDTLIGWVAVDRQDPQRVVHYCYVADNARRVGICRHFLSGMTDFWYTHFTDEGQKVAGKLGGTYDPYLLLRLLPMP